MSTAQDQPTDSDPVETPAASNALLQMAAELSVITQQFTALQQEMETNKAELEKERAARHTLEHRMLEVTHPPSTSIATAAAADHPTTSDRETASQLQMVAQMTIISEQFAAMHREMEANRSELQKESTARLALEQRLLDVVHQTSADPPASLATTVSGSPSLDSNTDAGVTGDGRERSGAIGVGATSWSGPVTRSNSSQPTLDRKPFDLPTFDGKPDQWPLFLSSLRQSTVFFGYSDLQNLFRLQKCLKGDALELVQGMLMDPVNLPAILKELEFHYGRPEIQIECQLKKIDAMPFIEEHQYTLYVPYSARVQNMVAILNTDACRDTLGESATMKKLVSKLPPNKQMDWSGYAAGLRGKPTAVEFAHWLREWALRASLVRDHTTKTTTNASRELQSTSGSGTSRRLLLNVTDDIRQTIAEKCEICDSEQHSPNVCKQFAEMSVRERWNAVRRLGMCFSCLGASHMAADCGGRQNCGTDGCNRSHHPLLHIGTGVQTVNSRARRSAVPANERRNRTLERASSGNNGAMEAHRDTNADPTPTDTRQNPFNRRNKLMLASECERSEPPLFRVLPVTVSGPKARVGTYALIDDGSALTLIDEELADQVGLSGPKSDLNIHWFGQHSSTVSSKKVSLTIKGAGMENHVIKGARTVRGLNLPVQTLRVSPVDDRHRHLRELPICEYRNAEPRVLIGLDNCHLGLATRTETGDTGGPIASKTPLGWVVYGTQAQSTSARVLHCAELDEKYERLDQIVRAYYSTESFGVRCVKRQLESDEDQRAREIMETTTAKVGDRYQTGLLWRTDDIRLPDSFQMALNRLRSVERKMAQEPAYAAKYAQQICGYVEKGYARKMSTREAAAGGERVWYLPHFGHVTIHKPDKLRIVFDAAASVHGTSLNSVLIKGPDLNQPLETILFRFRMRAVGVCGDIAEMFHQVMVQPSDRCAQRFLWRTDPKQPPDVYEMLAMTFGATCSPTSAQYVKNHNALAHQDEFPAAVEAIQHLHYVDDFVAAFDTEDEAARVTSEVVEIHRRGGFTLRGFVSNSSVVLDRLGVAGGRVHQVRLELDSKTTDKILGLRWSTETDAFVFSMRFEKVDADVMAGERIPTKRQILSAAMSVFDPFGFVADYMLHAKLMVQCLWRTATGWDDPVPDEINQRWRLWCRELHRIKLLSVPRCYSTDFTRADDLQLHVFADASEEAFAAIAYWRIVYDGRCTLAFVAAKTRCAPLKRLSVPRLELQAATLAVRLLQTIRASHDVQITKTVLWTDSTTVLGWIRSVNRRFPQFVSHRVGEILEGSSASWWRWLPTKENVADDATRSKERPTFDPESRWISGPSFLLGGESDWPAAKAEPTPGDEPLPEEIPGKFVGVASSTGELLIYGDYSDFSRIVRVVGWMLRFVANARARRQKGELISGELHAAEIREATQTLCQAVQMEAFSAEREALVQGKEVPINSAIRTLMPYIDDRGVIRIFGRTDAADVRYLPVEAQRPVLLPSGHHFTELLVGHHHRKMGHQLEDATICSIRQQFWVPRLRRLVRSVKNKCMQCRLRAARPCPPVAGQLPSDRLTPYVPAFTFSGLDYFGPVQVAVGRRREKRWIALFTCLATRAVHMEVAEDLTTDACLVAIRNFINIRGVPTRIRSDCGTNFVGADRILRRAEDFLDVGAIQTELAGRGVEWVFNCPANPEAGGAWERLVQSTKRVLAVILKTVAPRVETLRSFVIEAANILNSRPLTHVPVNAEDLEPITPNHFLIGRSNSTTTPAVGPDPKQLCQRAQWRVCLELRNQFWTRWVREYLPELTRRTQHHEDVRPLRVGDLVLVCDANVSRDQWIRGRVERTVVGTDGRIRTAEIRTGGGLMRRPVTKLAVLDVSGEEPAVSHGGGDVGEPPSTV